MIQTQKKRTTRKRKTPTAPPPESACPPSCPNLEVRRVEGQNFSRVYYGCRSAAHWLVGSIDVLPTIPPSCQRNQDWRTACWTREDERRTREIAVIELLKTKLKQTSYDHIASVFGIDKDKLSRFCYSGGIRKTAGRPNSILAFEARFRDVQLLALYGLTVEDIRRTIIDYYEDRGVPKEEVVRKKARYDKVCD